MENKPPIGSNRSRLYHGPAIDNIEKTLLVSMASHRSEISNQCRFNYLTIDGDLVIERTELKERKDLYDTLSKTQFEKLRDELRRTSEGGIWRHEKDWVWDDEKKQYVCRIPLLGEYIPEEKKVILYLKNIEDACKYDNVPYYCGVLTTFIHELFHAVHHEAAFNAERPYDTIREIEEAMTEFSTLVFLKELSSESSEWEDTFNWAEKKIKQKQWCLGSLPAYGFGYCLYDFFSKKEDFSWIEKYNQKVGAIDKKSRYVKWYQQMLYPEYPHGNEQLCMELLHSILFNI